MVLIYSHTVTNRLRYIFNYIFTELFSVPVEFTSDQEYYTRYNSAKLNYSSTPLLASEVFFPASTLLFETTIRETKPLVLETDSHFTFHLDGTRSHEHDPFAGAFYLISRYEEYLPFQKDIYGRFEANASILETRLSERPIVNIWAEEIVQRVKESYPSLNITPKEFSSIITIDVDQAFAFLHKNWWRKAAITFRAVRKGSYDDQQEWKQVIWGKAKDPNDTYQYLQEQAAKSKLPFIFFINVGARTRFDKNIRATKPVMRELISSLSTWAEVGVHPSYYSSEFTDLVTRETKLLATIVDKPVNFSRQHFIRLSFPNTYHHLLKSGIAADFSMGYASALGFRAGTCRPFFWFDLTSNQETMLKIYPFTFMEGTFAEDLQLSPNEAWPRIKKLINEVKRYNGLFIPIWHNHSVSDRGFWKGWKKVFEDMLMEIETGNG